MEGSSNYAAVYKAYSDADKQALKELKAETEKRLGIPVSLADMVKALEPGMDTPAHLQ